MTTDPTPALMQLRLSRRTPVNADAAASGPSPIVEFQLGSTDGNPLPPFEPGAHISVQTPSGAMRRYSLIGDPADRDHYVFAAKRESGGRGGSVSLHDELNEGGLVKVEAPANEFALVDAPGYLFIAGGIGITPVLSMVRALQRNNRTNWRLVYCTRSADQAAYLEELSSPALADRVVIHHDNGDPDQVFDLWPYLENPDASHIYCCGPEPLMTDVRDMTGHWPIPAVHFEDFSPVDAVRADDRAFEVQVGDNGAVITVPADKTVLEALRNAGLDRRSSCESGTCGTCKTRYLGGEVDHRDLCLTDEERRTHLMICVSRCHGDRLVIET